MSSYKQRRAVYDRINKMKLSGFRNIEIVHDDIQVPHEKFDENYYDIIAPVGSAHRIKEVDGRYLTELRRGCNKNFAADEYNLPRSAVSRSWAPDCTKAGCYPVKET